VPDEKVISNITTITTTRISFHCREEKGGEERRGEERRGEERRGEGRRRLERRRESIYNVKMKEMMNDDVQPL